MKNKFLLKQYSCQVGIFVCQLLIAKLFVLNSIAVAQDCFTENTYSIQPSSYTINSNTTWSSLNYRINSNLLITTGGGGSPTTLTIDASNLDIATGVYILVNTGCTLEIKNGSKLYSTNTWIGIIGKHGATIKVHDSGTAIADAEIAIDAKNNVTVQLKQTLKSQMMYYSVTMK